MIHSIAQQISKSDKQWFAVRTRLKCEKQVNMFLTNKSVDAYLPLLTYTRRWGRRIKNVELPLFSNYIFVNIDRSEYVKVLETEGVFGFVKFGNEICPIPAEEIELVQRVVGMDQEVKVEALGFEEGELVEIIGGKLTGTKAKVVERFGRKQVTIELLNIGFGLHLTIEENMIQRTHKLVREFV